MAKSKSSPANIKKLTKRYPGIAIQAIVESSEVLYSFESTPLGKSLAVAVPAGKKLSKPFYEKIDKFYSKHLKAEFGWIDISGSMTDKFMARVSTGMAMRFMKDGKPVDYKIMRVARGKCWVKRITLYRPEDLEENI